jgi:hypothetical protein
VVPPPNTPSFNTNRVKGGIFCVRAKPVPNGTDQTVGGCQAFVLEHDRCRTLVTEGQTKATFWRAGLPAASQAGEDSQATASNIQSHAEILRFSPGPFHCHGGVKPGPAQHALTQPEGSGRAVSCSGLLPHSESPRPSQSFSAEARHDAFALAEESRGGRQPGRPPLSSARTGRARLLRNWAGVQDAKGARDNPRAVSAVAAENFTTRASRRGTNPLRSRCCSTSPPASSSSRRRRRPAGPSPRPARATPRRRCRRWRRRRKPLR